jgi:hypothetical protein
MAPERFSLDGKIDGSSKEDDVYSFAMTSFEVRFSAVNCPTIRSNHTVTIQVLTGILPYGNGDRHRMAADIRRGKRPSRPWNPSRNRWLQDPVWDKITTCRSDKPEQRSELSAVYQVFLEYGQNVARNAKLGDLKNPPR